MKKKTDRKTIGADPWARHTRPTVAPQPAADATQRTARGKTAAPAAAPQIGAAATAPAFTPPAGKVQISLRFNPAVIERARNACAATGQTFQGLIDAALVHETERMEKEQNNGRPFPARSAALKTGPRMIG